MRITHQEKPKDPLYPIMHGDTPTAREFNRRQKAIWETGKFGSFSFEQVATILLEMFAEDYDKRHASKKKKPIIKEE